eukprot:TRINITY_DN22414_c0_g1_i1.p1 TRINITY_DN22414_c0_g1~~TRINITY_DN22414_c0_g1_i1.p1  ORF type:complete len:570 (+),score=57.79 TRINITY_DN22414_c0_g1_i1:112-1821(+)
MEAVSTDSQAVESFRHRLEHLTFDAVEDLAECVKQCVNQSPRHSAVMCKLIERKAEDGPSEAVRPLLMFLELSMQRAGYNSEYVLPLSNRINGIIRSCLQKADLKTRRFILDTVIPRWCELNVFPSRHLQSLDRLGRHFSASTAPHQTGTSSEGALPTNRRCPVMKAKKASIPMSAPAASTGAAPSLAASRLRMRLRRVTEGKYSRPSIPAAGASTGAEPSLAARESRLRMRLMSTLIGGKCSRPSIPAAGVKRKTTDGQEGSVGSRTTARRFVDHPRPEETQGSDAVLVSSLRAELEAARQRALAAEARAAAFENELKQGSSRREATDVLREIEAWRHLDEHVCLYTKAALEAPAQSALRSTVPRSHTEPCRAMREVNVTSVRSVVNVQLWKKYSLQRQQMAEKLQGRQDCPWARELPHLAELAQLFPHISLDCRANEVLLLHGTENRHVQQIIEQGFDERLSKRGLYGRGVYFASEACKAAQYCYTGKGRCIIVARALVGYPYFAQGPLQQLQRPPEQTDGTLYDSIIAKPGIPNGKGGSKGSQLHWEFVIPRGDLQAYPELVIYFD